MHFRPVGCDILTVYFKESFFGFVDLSAREVLSDQTETLDNANVQALATLFVLTTNYIDTRQRNYYGLARNGCALQSLLLPASFTRPSTASEAILCIKWRRNFCC